MLVKGAPDERIYYEQSKLHIPSHLLEYLYDSHKKEPIQLN